MIEWSERQLAVQDAIVDKQPRHVLLYGGTRSGKTFLTVWMCVVRCLMAPGHRGLIARQAHNAVRKTIMLGTFQDVMRAGFPEVRYTLNQTDQIARFPNGSELWFSGLDDGDRLDKILGTEFATIYLNETSQVPWSSIAIVRSRLAQNVTTNVNGADPRPLVQRAFYDLNPTGTKHWTRLEWFEGKTPTGGEVRNRHEYLACQVNPVDAPWLSSAYLSDLEALDTRARNRMLRGEYSDDVAGALWAFEDIDPHRVTFAPPLDRVVVAIDPSISGGDTSDEAGIVGVGAANGHGYVLDDVSGRMHPVAWAQAAVDMYRRLQASEIVAEDNQGGEMVAVTIRSIDERVPVRLVKAVGSKDARATPVAALYRRGLVHHVGRFDKLEDEQTTWLPDPPPGQKRWSPGRIDALVHGLTRVMPHALAGLFCDVSPFAGSNPSHYVEPTGDVAWAAGMGRQARWNVRDGL